MNAIIERARNQGKTATLRAEIVGMADSDFYVNNQTFRKTTVSCCFDDADGDFTVMLESCDAETLAESRKAALGLAVVLGGHLCGGALFLR